MFYREKGGEMLKVRLIGKGSVKVGFLERGRFLIQPSGTFGSPWLTVRGCFKRRGIVQYLGQRVFCDWANSWDKWGAREGALSEVNLSLWS